MGETKAEVFPKYVYKKGTAQLVAGKEDCYTAESALLTCADDASKLPGQWCDSPADCSSGAAKADATKTVVPKTVK